MREHIPGLWDINAKVGALCVWQAGYTVRDNVQEVGNTHRGWSAGMSQTMRTQKILFPPVRHQRRYGSLVPCIYINHEPAGMHVRAARFYLPLATPTQPPWLSKYLNSHPSLYVIYIISRHRGNLSSRSPIGTIILVIGAVIDISHFLRMVFSWEQPWGLVRLSEYINNHAIGNSLSIAEDLLIYRSFGASNWW